MTTEVQTTRVSSQFLAAATTGLKTVLAATGRQWRVWKNRREARQLLGWDERALRDIGLTPMDVQLAMALPGSVDASSRLRILAVERRAGERAMAEERRAKKSATEAAASTPTIKRREKSSQCCDA